MRTGTSFLALLWILWAYAFWGSQLCRLMDGLVQRLVDRAAVKAKRIEDPHEVAMINEVAMLIDGQWTIVTIYGLPWAIVCWGSGYEKRYELADELLPTDDGRLLPVYR